MEVSDFISIFFYVIIFIIFGYIFGNYLSKKFVPLREGARTLPRPVINPRVPNYENEKPKNIPIPGQTINKMIDNFTNKYFKKDGFPLESTIHLYMSTFCDKGNIDPENKRKLTDIGYYILDIVIPNVPSTNNPEPNVYWPPIKWTNHKIFNILSQPTPTYEILQGQNYKDTYINTSTSSYSGRNISSLFGNEFDNNIDTDGSSNNNNNKGDNNKKAIDSCKDDENSCGIGCPTSCLSGVFASEVEKQNKADSSSNSNDGSNINQSISSGGRKGDQVTSQNIPGTTLLPGGVNQLIIGSAGIDGFQITDCKQTSDSPDLNNEVNDFIEQYFITDGPNKNRPTQEAIDLFDQFNNKTPMDGFHMNKMRDLVYYVLQVIIPGLPTEKSGRSYVEWRPIRWLSLSYKT